MIINIFAGRRSGKKLYQDNEIDKALKAGRTVAIGSVEGFFCAACGKEWDTCHGRHNV